jgi:hypothetical protein
MERGRAGRRRLDERDPTGISLADEASDQRTDGVGALSFRLKMVIALRCDLRSDIIGDRARSAQQAVLDTIE